ncbi:MAG TPA: hypothetical protein VMG59_04855 [Phycisphaerae bacterium]|nr:hypothetical protein [Phycisphaerae bacterium]
MEANTPSEPLVEKSDSSAPQDLPEAPADGRVQATHTGGNLIIKIKRSSVFWQPTTLIAVWLLLFPLVIFMTAWVVYLLIGKGDLARRFLSWEPSLPWIIVGAAVTWLAFFCALISAVKTVEFIADREKVRVQMRWLFFKKSCSWSVEDLRDFSYDEYVGQGKSGGVLWRAIYLLPRKGHAVLLFQTARLPFEHMNYIAIVLRHFYGR